MSDPLLATLDDEHGSHLREITALKVGNVSMTCKVFHHRRHSSQFDDGRAQEENEPSVVSVSQLKIRVRLVTSVEIPYKQSVVYSGSMTKHLAVLKYRDETFDFGTGPISFSWNSSHPSILKPDPPLKSLADDSMVEETAGNLHQKQKTVRDNKANNDKAKFVTSFNSSSVYSKAMKSGEVLLFVKMAIEYPSVYSKEQNWFESKVLIKVQDRLSVSVP